jgi:hypothetical protein
VRRRRHNASCGGFAVKEEAAGRDLAPPGRLITMKEVPGRIARNTGNRCPMAKPFHELWRAMENWRHHIEAGEPPALCRFERMCRPERRFSGCPDEETLCGLGDGQLYRAHLRRWLCIWLHVRIRRCPGCLAHMAALASAIPQVAEDREPDKLLRD